MSDKVRKRVLVSGLVQGVNFRANTRSAARRIGVAGWVRNLPDGRVEAVIEGDSQSVEAMLAWLRKGPTYSRVDKLDVREELPTGEFSDFDVTYMGGYHW
jgi:acylphosphatase